MAASSILSTRHPHHCMELSRHHSVELSHPSLHGTVLYIIAWNCLIDNSIELSHPSLHGTLIHHSVELSRHHSMELSHPSLHRTVTSWYLDVHVSCFPSQAPNRHHLSCGDCLKDKREDYQSCSVLYCVPQLYTVISTHIKDVTEPANIRIRRMRISCAKSIGCACGCGFVARSKLPAVIATAIQLSYLKLELQTN